MDLFAPRTRPGAAKISELKSFVAERLRLPETATVMITELQCSEPGCPPLETVVAVLEAGAPTRQFKVHKAIAEVTEQDLQRLLGEESAH